MAENLEVTPSVVIPAAELRERFSRSSGPGGQGVNTADSRVELSFDLANSTALPDHLRDRALDRLANRLVDGVLTVAASEHRNQLANRQAARARLAVLLRNALRPPAPTRRATKPSRGSVERRLSAKRRRSDVKRSRRANRDD
ncbi:MAG TPA: alternative ribosome rescue aminoacyl-tRNA hydrolase ArfB [Pseudonocardiaceae bacterium]|nr:alternative ribosome rescue aminoacyl-tRNA hydrolase ArfB [Pseudonocardiaceae bacterium]